MVRSNFSKIIFSLAGFLLISSCNKQSEKLPYFGEFELVNNANDIDTIFPKVPAFEFVNQEGEPFSSEKQLAGKIYVADFFFTSCPTICPKMKSELLRVYDQFSANSNFGIVSFTIDPEHDTVAVLKDYADRLEVKSNSWNFLTGNRDTIYNLAAKGFLSIAKEDADEPGGFIHSGYFLLIDPNKHLRGVYDGTDPKDVDRLLKELPVLIEEFFGKQ